MSDSDGFEMPASLTGGNEARDGDKSDENSTVIVDPDRKTTIIKTIVKGNQYTFRDCHVHF